MKFESKLGLGEVCIYGERRERNGRSTDDILVKIVGVHFTPGGVCYCCEYNALATGIQRIWIDEDELQGDPDYDQEAGCYPPEV